MIASLRASRFRFFAAIFLVVAFCAAAAAQEQRRGFYAPALAETVHPVFAESGMVVAQEKTAGRVVQDVHRGSLLTSESRTRATQASGAPPR